MREEIINKLCISCGRTVGYKHDTCPHCGGTEFQAGAVKYHRDPATHELYPVEGKGQNIRGFKTGVIRPPRAGEYYISGAIPIAYRAVNDLTTAYHIAGLVEVKQITTYQIVKYL